MMIQIILQSLTALVFLLAVSFIFYYSRFRWEDNPEGRNIISITAALALLSSGYFITRFLETLYLSRILVIAGWGILALALIWRFIRVYQLHKKEEERD